MYRNVAQNVLHIVTVESQALSLCRCASPGRYGCMGMISLTAISTLCRLLLFPLFPLQVSGLFRWVSVRFIGHWYVGTWEAYYPGAFLAQVRGLAAQLPSGRYVVNLCEDRYHFLLAFYACCITWPGFSFTVFTCSGSGC